jgi:hypothetical protein
VLREIISPAILKHRWDTMLMRAVARHYYMQLRRLVRTTVLQGALASHARNIDP